MSWPDAVALVATPPGPGGVAVIQVVGSGARAAAIRAGIRLTPAPAFTRLDDDVLAHELKAAHSPWKQPTVEISCHGGAAAPRRILQRLGVPEVRPGEMLDELVRRKRLDRTQAEARLALPGALTNRAAAMLLDQAAGALGRAIRTMKNPRRLLAGARSGRALVDPPHVVLAGRPNAGKSTLLNALAGRDRALVSDVPGTTRDPVEEVVSIDGFPIRLIDTAGLMKDPGGPDTAAVARSHEEAAGAALVVWVRDAREPSRGFGALRVAAKMDLPGAAGDKDEIPVSSIRGQGLDRLRKAILRVLGLKAPPKATVFTARQQALLEALAAGGKRAEITRKLLWT